ncbi:MAG: PLP-dependent aminotransferase family protein [Oscillospiraceae bacterium]|nr:PLP-dependent aminotransferase family protein [Oscillospiraceae bacterium]
MMVQFADRMKDMKGSDIRDILRFAAVPGMYYFAGGMPAPELFPVQEMKACADLVMDEMGASAMQYSSTEGYPRLREQIAQRLAEKNNIHADKDQILITSGSQQGLDYAGRVFLNEGDVVVMESPSYLGAINAFKTCQPRFVTVPTDEDGMIMEALDQVLATTPNVKMIYVIPDFQNPTGRTWPLERRKQFMEIVNRYEIPVVEDNPYGELRFDGAPLPALKSLDTKELIIYLGTFSKILAPGYRLAWVCAGAEILKKFNIMQQAASLQASTVSQMETAKYLDTYSVDAHIAAIRETYARRCRLMVDTMAATFPEAVRFTRPKGGLFTWAELPAQIDTRVMAKQALEKMVAYVPGAGFFPNGGNNHCLRLNYSNMPDERIVDGITILAEVIKENLAR